MKPKRTTVRRVRAYAGFVYGKISRGWIKDMNYDDTLHGIWATREVAEQYCDDVRPIFISFSLPKRKKDGKMT